MPKQNLDLAGKILLETIERLDQKEYERLIGPGFKRLTDEDLVFLRDHASQELARRRAQNKHTQMKYCRGPAPNAYCYG